MARQLNNGLHSGGEHVGFGLEDGSTPALDLVGPARHTAEELAYLFTDLALVAKHVLAVTSARTQPQMASSALKSGL